MIEQSRRRKTSSDLESSLCTRGPPALAGSGNTSRNESCFSESVSSHRFSSLSLGWSLSDTSDRPDGDPGRDLLAASSISIKLGDLWKDVGELEAPLTERDWSRVCLRRSARIRRLVLELPSSDPAPSCSLLPRLGSPAPANCAARGEGERRVPGGAEDGRLGDPRPLEPGLTAGGVGLRPGRGGLMSFSSLNASRVGRLSLSMVGRPTLCGDVRPSLGQAVVQAIGPGGYCPPRHLTQF